MPLISKHAFESWIRHGPWVSVSGTSRDHWWCDERRSPWGGETWRSTEAALWSGEVRMDSLEAIRLMPRRCDSQTPPKRWEGLIYFSFCSRRIKFTHPSYFAQTQTPFGPINDLRFRFIISLWRSFVEPETQIPGPWVSLDLSLGSFLCSVMKHFGLYFWSILRSLSVVEAMVMLRATATTIYTLYI